ncbi:MAG: hypothetical protein Q9188_007344 [Gyalolechia gomerana]
MAGAPYQQRRGDNSHHAEQDDVACAIATSLASPKSNAPTAPERWFPRSEQDWRIYHQQKEIEDIAQDYSMVKNQSHWRRDRDSQSDASRQVQVNHASPRRDSGTSTSTEQDPQPPTTLELPEEDPPSPRQTIDDRIKEMMQGNPVDLPWIDDHDGDTWVFIDPAAQQPEQTDHMYQAYVERYRKPLMIESITLKSLQSSFFDKLFEASYQYRVVRRRKLKGKLPAQIKYVIDLTPPTEGDEAAWLMSELCCIDGLRNWSQAESRWQISNIMVGGRDDFTAPPANTGETPPVPEISPIRHRACIERALNAIRNIDPKLDSAVKVYTTFIVARFFDITRSPLTDYIVRWVRAPPNSLFIEAFPEVTLKMGDGLQCSELIRDSFAILVGQEALELLRRKPNLDRTVYGRKKNDIPESYKTRIEYASKNLQGRVSRVFEDLVDPDMKWMETLPEYKKLLLDDNSDLSPLLTETKMALKAFVRGAIYDVLYSDLIWAPNLWLGTSGGDCLYPRTSRHSFWNTIETTMRIMTTTFWQALKQSRASSFSKPPNTTNLSTWAKNGAGWGFSLSDASMEALVQLHGIVEIRHAYLRDLIWRCCDGQAPPFRDAVVSLKPLERQPQDLPDTAILPLPLPEITEPVGSMTSHSPNIFWASEGTPPGPRLAPAERGSPDMGAYLSGQESRSDQHTVASKPSGEDTVLMRLNLEILDYIESVCDKMTGPPDSDRTEPMSTDMTLTLVCLDQSEWKYLPLYAGGLDDGSGGVFNDDVPIADVGFSTAGPRIHTGTGSSTASNEFDFVGHQDLDSTHHTSTMTNDGFSDHMDRRRVYDGNSDLWDQIMRKKDTKASTMASRVETGAMAAPSTIGAESDDGFVLPIRTKASDAQPYTSMQETHVTNAQDSQNAAAIDQDDYESIFADSDDEDDNDDNDGEDDEDDDTATEKGDDEHITSEDEELVIV